MNIENHPIKTILGTFIAGCTLSWAILTFVLDDNKEKLHQAEIENIKAQINNKASLIERYEQKVSVLEEENIKLQSVNKIYWECISQNKELTLYLKAKLDKVLTEQKKTQLEFYQNEPIKSDSTKVDEIKSKLSINTTIKKSNSYINKELRLIIGIKEISVLNEAKISLNIDGKDIVKEENVSAGKVYKFKNQLNDYILVVKKIDYIYDVIEIEIVEL